MKEGGVNISSPSLECKTRTTLRGRTANNFDGKHYQKRSKVETILSIIKRKYGSCLKTKSFDDQKKKSYANDRLIKISAL